MVNRLTAAQIRTLRETVAAETDECKVRNCGQPGTFYGGRLTKIGHLRRGYYCDFHDRLFGFENLQRWADEGEGRVVTLRDVDGEYEGVLFAASTALRG